MIAIRKADIFGLHALAYIPFAILAGGFLLPIGLWVLQLGSFPVWSAVQGTPFLSLFWNTLFVGAVTTAISICLAYPIALLLWMSSRRTAFAIGLIVFLPVVVGFLARNYSWIGMMSGQDTVSSLGLSLIGVNTSLYTMQSVILVMTYIFVPIAFFILLQSLASISRHEVDGARTLGATELEIVWRLALPRTFRQATIGALLIFANASAYFVTPRMLGGGKYDLLGNLIWRNTNLGEFSAASAVSIWFLLFFGPFYVMSLAIVLRSRKKILGR